MTIVIWTAGGSQHIQRSHPKPQLRASISLSQGQLYMLLTPSPNHIHQLGGLRGGLRILFLQASALQARNYRVTVVAISGVQGDSAGNTAIFKPNPRVDYVLAKLGLFDKDLSTSTGPVRVATVPRVSVEAEV